MVPECEPSCLDTDRDLAMINCQVQGQAHRMLLPAAAYSAEPWAAGRPTDTYRPTCLRTETPR